MSDVEGFAGLDDERRRDLDQAMYVGLSRTRRQMLGDHADGVLDRVEVERRLVMETTKAFDRAVTDARAADFTWQQITDRVPGLVTAYGPRAVESLFDMVAVVGSRLGERYAPWRCGECDGLVRDYGPYGGHPVDVEPGHGWSVSAKPLRSQPMRPVWKPMISRQLASRGPPRTTLETWSISINRLSSKPQAWAVMRNPTTRS